MNNPGIFLIQQNGELLEMNEQAYDSEDLLQMLLAKYPSLLAGNQIDPKAPRKWLFIEREAGVPSAEDGGGRWSADHLFLDQDAIPTIVEVKRSTDTRIRREVVGQMLDYAANAVVYWPADRLRERFAKTHGESADERLGEFLDDQMEPEQFWQLANKNLQDRKVRLLFVADEIPTELQRIVEFLNEQMDRTEVLAVEIKQFVGGSRTALAPRVIGRTAKAQQEKSSGPPPPLRTLQEILEELNAKAPDEAGVVHQILDWSSQYPTRRVRCVQSGFFLEFEYDATRFSPVSIVPNTRRLYVLPKKIKQARPFVADENWKEFRRRLDRLDQIYGVKFPDSPEWASVKLADLTNEDALKAFLEIIAWSIERVETAQREQSISVQPQSAES